jgi:serine/threonine protein phosphatase PrpC
MKFEVFGDSLKSRKNRETNSHNEDAFAFDKDLLYGIVADGNGAPDLEIFFPSDNASRTAVDLIRGGIEEIIADETSNAEEAAKNQFVEAHKAVIKARERFREIKQNDYLNRALRFKKIISDEEIARVSETLKSLKQPDIGTTATAFFVYDEKIYVPHIGDCRAYVQFKDGRFEQVTEVQKGGIYHLGTDDENKLDIKVYSIPLEDVAAVAVVSDGIANNLVDNDIKKIIAENSAMDAARLLVKKADTDPSDDIIRTLAHERHSDYVDLDSNIPEEFEIKRQYMREARMEKLGKDDMTAVVMKLAEEAPAVPAIPGDYEEAKRKAAQYDEAVEITKKFDANRFKNQTLRIAFKDYEAKAQDFENPDRRPDSPFFYYNVEEIKKHRGVRRLERLYRENPIVFKALDRVVSQAIHWKNRTTYESNVRKLKNDEKYLKEHIDKIFEGGAGNVKPKLNYECSRELADKIAESYSSSEDREGALESVRQQYETQLRQMAQEREQTEVRHSLTVGELNRRIDDQAGTIRSYDTRIEELSQRVSALEGGLAEEPPLNDYTIGRALFEVEEHEKAKQYFWKVIDNGHEKEKQAWCYLELITEKGNERGGN